MGCKVSYNFFLHISTLLIFSSACTQLDFLLNEFGVAVTNGDIPRLKAVAGRIILLAGEVALLRFINRMLERAQRVVAA